MARRSSPIGPKARVLGDLTHGKAKGGKHEAMWGWSGHQAKQKIEGFEMNVFLRESVCERARDKYHAKATTCPSLLNLGASLTWPI